MHTIFFSPFCCYWNFANKKGRPLILKGAQQICSKQFFVYNRGLPFVYSDLWKCIFNRWNDGKKSSSSSIKTSIVPHSDVLMKTFQALCLVYKRGRSSVTDILVAKRIPQDYFLSSKTSLTRIKNLFVLDDISKDQSFLGHTMNIFFF